MKVVSRDELHAEVWAEPMTKVAERYGISDVSLKKICSKHRIPTPPRGYWAKRAAGKKVKKTHYTKITDSYMNVIRVSGIVDRMGETVAKEVKAAEKKVKQKTGQSQKYKREAVDQLHPLVERLQKKLPKLKASYDGLCRMPLNSGIQVDIAAASFERLIAFTQNFCTEAEARDHSFKNSKNGVVLVIDGEALQFKFFEKLDRARHVNTEKEAKQLAEWEKKERAKSYNWHEGEFKPFSWNRPNVPDYDYTPNDLLVFQYTETEGDGLRRTFGDGKKQRLEKMLDDILLAGVKLIAARKAHKVEREQQRFKQAEEMKEWKERRALQNLEKRRIEGLEKMASAWKKVNELKTFVEAVKYNLPKVGDKELTLEWIMWAEHYIETKNLFLKGSPRLLKREDFREWELSYS